MRIRTLTAATVALASTVLACGGAAVTQPTASLAPPISQAPDSSVEPPSEAPASEAPASEEPGSGSTSVTIIDNDFTPSSVEVALGGQVVWTNTGQNPHTVTFDDDGPDSGTLATRDTFEATFEEAGEFTYVCEIHSSMSGTVTVTE